MGGQRPGPDAERSEWFLGSADALYQNLNILADEKPKYVFVFGADHIYRIDPRQMLDEHIASGAGVTVAALRVPHEESKDFGVIDPGHGTKINRFLEKPAPDTISGLDDDPDQILASMGNYVFDTEVLIDLLHQDAANPNSKRDVGGNLIPTLVKSGQAHFYDFTTNEIPGQQPYNHYWRDVGTVDSYFDAHMDLVAPVPSFDLYNPEWPIHTLGRNTPPAKIVNDAGGNASRVTRSLLSNGVVVSGASVNESVLSPGVYLDSKAEVSNCILLDGVRIGAGARVRNAVIDKSTIVPPGAYIGWNHADDADRFTVSEGGVVVIPKGMDLGRYCPAADMAVTKISTPTVSVNA